VTSAMDAAGHTASDWGMESSFRRVGTRTLKPDTKYSHHFGKECGSDGTCLRAADLKNGLPWIAMRLWNSKRRLPNMSS